MLEKWAGARATERRLVDRARIVLMAGEGRPASEIAQRVGCSLVSGLVWVKVDGEVSVNNDRAAKLTCTDPKDRDPENSGC